MNAESLHLSDPSVPRWRRAASFARPYRGRIAVILLLTLLSGGLAALEPMLFGWVFDALTRDDAATLLAKGVGGFVALAVVNELVNGLNNWLTWRTRIGINQRLLEATVSRLQRIPLRYHRTEGVGELMTRVDRGIQGFVTALSELAFNVLPALVYLTTSVVIMLRMDARLTALVLVFAPLPALIGALAAPEQTRRERALLDHWSRIYGRFNEVLHAILTVRSFGMEDVERDRFVRQVDDANRVVVRGVARDTGVEALRNVFVAAARIGAIGYGGWLVLRGETTVGTVLAFTGYISGLFGPVQGLTGVYQTVRKGRVSLDAVFDILDVRDDPADAPNARPLGAVRGDVRFEGVRFAYEPGGTPVLDDFDLHVRAGETVALVGPSGAGKTTTVSLLQRLYDPDAGRVTVDGVDLRDLDQRSLRRRIGVVLQDGVLFNDTVRANIAYGRPDASLDRIREAACAAHADEFIERLPRGYDTALGVRGGLLSAGQRQRIAIARALLKDPPILVLDEATSALDAESEALVQEALDRLLAGRTSFVVAHRLSTVVAADRILVMRGGRIVEQGDHATLLREDGFYAELVRKQTRGLKLLAA